METFAENSAKIALYWTFVTLRLPELEYLLFNLTALANQLGRYKLAEANISAYLQSAAKALAFVPPT